MKKQLLMFIGALFLCIGTVCQAQYPLGPDSQFKQDVPHGETTHYTWKTSKIYPGTERDYWVYVPKQYDPATPAAVMIFQDGGGFQGKDGQFRVPVVFDNLIASKQMPVTVAIMINPGVAPAMGPNALPRYNRSHEYDATTDAYARFLIEEILPEVGKKLNLTKDPAGRALCGASSGGICSFITAWERPDQFSKVVSFVGSFTDLQGGNTYASAIRKYEPRPIRVVLQDGSADQDIYSGVWFLGNNDVAMALRFAGYDYQFITGTGGHNGEQGGQILPDALRFIWRDYPNPVARPAGNRQPVMEVVKPGESWKLVAEETVSVAGITADSAGNVYTSEGTPNRIMRIDKTGITTQVAASHGSRVLAFGPDGKIYAGHLNRHSVTTYDNRSEEKTIATGLMPSDLVVSHTGNVYVTDEQAGKVWLINNAGKKTLVDELPGASGVTLTPDQTLLHVSTSVPGKYVYSYRIKPDGTLIDKQTFFDLRLDYATAVSNAAGMATDTQGRLYVSTNTGVQILDQAGRVIGVLENPDRKPTTAITFGGANLDQLYVIAGDKLYVRTVRSKGVQPFAEPIKPPGPRL